MRIRNGISAPDDNLVEIKDQVKGWLSDLAYSLQAAPLAEHYTGIPQYYSTASGSSAPTGFYSVPHSFKTTPTFMLGYARSDEPGFVIGIPVYDMTVGSFATEFADSKKSCFGWAAIDSLGPDKSDFFVLYLESTLEEAAERAGRLSPGAAKSKQ